MVYCTSIPGIHVPIQGVEGDVYEDFSYEHVGKNQVYD